jgi:glycosyltransferase involved in cell wall biosynthesis
MQTVDSCLLLEGTYPYVRGGVSAWLHQLLRELNELTFALVFIGGRRADYGEAKYELPPNVVHLEAHYLEDALQNCAPRRVRLADWRQKNICALHDELQSSASGGANEPTRALDSMLLDLGRERGLRLPQFLYSSGAWDILCRAYVARGHECSFLDYFWTLRLLHAPLFQLAAIADHVPVARAYHSISTGYAGFLASLLARRRARPFILSEHGIYTKERRIDLNQTEWFDPTQGRLGQFEPGLAESRGVMRELWIRYFESLGRIAYRSAEPIIALSEGNRARQIKDGAAPERIRVVSNGIDVSAFEPALLARPAVLPQVVGLIGRVVPIKDVKTFIRAIGGVIAAIPSAQGWVIGGADEEPAYARECAALVQALGLGAHVKFLGHQQTQKVLPQLGIVMLTSVSEGQPLVILEAFAAGVPCIATDVGACAELVEGRDAEDRALGRAGRIVPFADADALAQAAVELLSNQDEWQACQVAGLQRVRRYYQQRSMVDAYRGFYTTALEASSA